MASSGKKKGNKKNSWKPLPPDAVLQTSINKKSTNWAEEVDQAEAIANDRISSKPVVLPTAPRASRANDFDESKVPTQGPYAIHIANIPYEVDEEDLIAFFQGMNIKSIRLPRDDKRSKGFGNIEFEDRESLIAALNKPDTVMKNRPIKIELATQDLRGGMYRGGRGGRDGGGMMMRGDGGGMMRGENSSDPDRTSGNWRSGPREGGFGEDRMSFDRGGGFGGGRREFSSGGGGFRSGFDREDRGGLGMGRDRDDRGGGFREDRGGSGFREDRGGNSFREDRGGSGFREERDRGFDRRRDDFDRGFRDDRSNFRDRGTFRDRHDEERRDERTGGSWRDDSRPNYSQMDDRRDDRRRDDRDRESRFRGPRRDDLPPVDRAPAPSGERKKLVLQPRSADLPPPESIPPPAAPQASIFGGAKPVDTSAREREVEERLVRGEIVVEKGPPGPRSTGGGSTSSRERELSESEKSVTVAPPPKDNAWRDKPTSPVVNNGRTTPEPIAAATTQEEKSDAPKAWGPKKQEPRRTEEQKPNRQPPKTGPPSIGQDKGRPKDDKPPHKLREPKTIDDVSKMPKLVENQAPNFTATNKYTALEDEEDDVAE